MRNATKFPRNHVLEFRFFASDKFLCTMSYATLFPVSSAHNRCNLSISSGASACLLQTAVLLLSSEYPYWLKLNSKLSENYSQTCTLSSFSCSVDVGRTSFRCRGFLRHGQGEELAANWLFTFIRGN